MSPVTILLMAASIGLASGIIGPGRDGIHYYTEQFLCGQKGWGIGPGSIDNEETCKEAGAYLGLEWWGVLSRPTFPRCFTFTDVNGEGEGQVFFNPDAETSNDPSIARVRWDTRYLEICQLE